MKNLKETLMDMDNLTEKEANICITDAREIMYEYIECGDENAAQNICEELWGLEPDYLMDLI